MSNNVIGTYKYIYKWYCIVDYVMFSAACAFGAHACNRASENSELVCSACIHSSC